MTNQLTVSLGIRQDGNRVLVSSRDVARVFEKEHSKVMTSIKNLSVSEEFNAANFSWVEYEDQKGEHRPECLMSKDGLVFLVLGYTGEKAARFKEAYIKAFNEMEEKLRQQKVPLTRKELLIQNIQLQQELLAEIEAREVVEHENTVLLLENQEMKPRVAYLDLITNSRELLNTTQIAKDYGYGPAKFNQLLHDLKVQYKQNDQWLLYVEYADEGYAQSVTRTYEHTDGTQGSKHHTKWTQRGREFLYYLLRDHGVLPVCERKQLTF